MSFGVTPCLDKPISYIDGGNSQVNWKQRILRRLELGCFPLGTASSAQQPQYQTFSSPLPSAYITAHPQVCCYFTQITQFCWPLTPSYMFVLPFSLVFSAQDFLEPHCFACVSPFLSWVSSICPRLQPVSPIFPMNSPRFGFSPWIFPRFFHGFPMDFPWSPGSHRGPHLRRRRGRLCFGPLCGALDGAAGSAAAKGLEQSAESAKRNGRWLVSQILGKYVSYMDWYVVSIFYIPRYIPEIGWYDESLISWINRINPIWYIYISIYVGISIEPLVFGWSIC